MKSEVIQAIYDADIAQTDWAQTILQTISDKYARGYLTAKLETLGESTSSHDEDYRQSYLYYCGFDIWDK